MPLKILVPYIDASQVITGRFDKANIEATLNKILKGAGAGSNCVEIDPPAGFAAQADVTGSRAVETIYRNTGGSPMLVTISTHSIGGGYPPDVIVYCDAGATPSVQVAAFRADDDTRYGPVTFVVPDDYYYQLHSVTAGKSGVTSWIEWQ